MCIYMYLYDHRIVTCSRKSAGFVRWITTSGLHSYGIITIIVIMLVKNKYVFGDDYFFSFSQPHCTRKNVYNMMMFWVLTVYYKRFRDVPRALFNITRCKPSPPSSLYICIIYKHNHFPRRIFFLRTNVT